MKMCFLGHIYDCVPVKLDKPDFEAPHFKTFLLLRVHFLCLQLPLDLTSDQVLVLEKVLNLLSARVNFMLSNAWLGAFGTMDLLQMVVQAMSESDSLPEQILHFEPDVSILRVARRVLLLTRRCRSSNDARRHTLSRCMILSTWRMTSGTSYYRWATARCTYSFGFQG